VAETSRGNREDTVDVRLEDSIVAQLLGNHRLVLDWQVQRQLTGAPKRVWYYLGARANDFPPRGRMKGSVESSYGKPG
jgi:hypothetical protein